VSYYTSVVGDEVKLATVERTIRAFTYKCRDEAFTRYGDTRSRGGDSSEKLSRVWGKVLRNTLSGCPYLLRTNTLTTNWSQLGFRKPSLRHVSRLRAVFHV